MSSKPTVGKSGQTKIVKPASLSPSPQKLDPGGENLQRVPIKKPTSMKEVESGKQFLETMTKIDETLAAGTPVQKKNVLENMGLEFCDAFKTKHGILLNRENFGAVASRITKDKVRDLRSQNEMLHNKLFQNSTASNKVRHMERADQAKANLMNKLKEVITDSPTLSAEGMGKLQPLLQDYVSHLATAYGVKDKIDAEHAANGKTDFQLDMDTFIARLPKLKEVVVDENIPYLEELNEPDTLSDVPEYLASASMKATEEEVRYQMELENYRICSFYPLLSDDKTQDIAARFPLENAELHKTVMVTAVEYNQNQILNRIRAKLAKNRLRRKQIQVTGFFVGHRNHETFTAELLFEHFKGLLKTKTASERHSILSSETTLRSWMANNRSPNAAIANYKFDNMVQIREWLIQDYPLQIGVLTNTNEVLISKSEPVNAGIMQAIWVFFAALKGIFFDIGANEVVEEVENTTQIPTKTKGKIKYSWTTLGSLFVGIALLIFMLTSVLGVRPETRPEFNSVSELKSATSITDFMTHNVSNTTSQFWRDEINRSVSNLDSLDRAALSIVAPIFDTSPAESLNVSQWMNVEAMSPTQLKSIIHEDIVDKVFNFKDLDIFEERLTEALTLVKPVQKEVKLKIMKAHKSYVSANSVQKPGASEVFIKYVDALVNKTVETADYTVLRGNLKKDINRLFEYKVQRTDNEITNSSLNAVKNVLDVSKQTLADLKVLTKSMNELDSIQVWRRQHAAVYDSMTPYQKDLFERSVELRQNNPSANTTQINQMLMSSLSESVVPFQRKVMRDMDRHHVQAYMMQANLNTSLSWSSLTWSETLTEMVSTLEPLYTPPTAMTTRLEEQSRLIEQRVRLLESWSVFDPQTFRNFFFEKFTNLVTRILELMSGDLPVLTENDIALYLFSGAISYNALKAIYRARAAPDNTVDTQYPYEREFTKLKYSFNYFVLFCCGLSQFYFSYTAPITAALGILALNLRTDIAAQMIVVEYVSRTMFSDQPIEQAIVSVLSQFDFISATGAITQQYFDASSGVLSSFLSIFSQPNVKTLAKTGLLSTYMLGSLAKGVFNIFAARSRMRSSKFALLLKAGNFNPLSLSSPLINVVERIANYLYPTTTVTRNTGGNRTKQVRLAENDTNARKQVKLLAFASIVLSASAAFGLRSEQVLNASFDTGSIVQRAYNVVGIHSIQHDVVHDLAFMKTNGIVDRFWNVIPTATHVSPIGWTKITTRENEYNSLYAGLFEADQRKLDEFVSYRTTIPYQGTDVTRIPFGNYEIGLVRHNDENVIVRKVGDRWISFDRAFNFGPSAKPNEIIKFSKDKEYTFYQSSPDDKYLASVQSDGQIVWINKELFWDPLDITPAIPTYEELIGEATLKQVVPLANGNVLQEGRYSIAVKPDGTVSVITGDGEVLVPGQILKDVELNQPTVKPNPVSIQPITEAPAAMPVFSEKLNQPVKFVPKVPTPAPEPIPLPEPTPIVEPTPVPEPTPVLEPTPVPEPVSETPDSGTYFYIKEAHIEAYNKVKGQSQTLKPTLDRNQVWQLASRTSDGKLILTGGKQNDKRVEDPSNVSQLPTKFEMRFNRGYSWKSSAQIWQDTNGNVLFALPQFLTSYLKSFFYHDIDEGTSFNVTTTVAGFEFTYEGRTYVVNIPRAVFNITRDLPIESKLLQLRYGLVSRRAKPGRPQRK